MLEGLKKNVEPYQQSSHIYHNKETNQNNIKSITIETSLESLTKIVSLEIILHQKKQSTINYKGMKKARQNLDKHPELEEKFNEE